MANLSVSGVRNVALVGHHGAGKTTLAEALLAATGTINRQGSIEKGNTVCDTEPEAVNRQLSIGLAVAPYVLDSVKVNVIDTPGYPDFEADVLAGLRAAELAVLVVSATDGVQPQTVETWQAAADLGLPRVVVVNKLDRERADFDGTLEQIRAAFGAGIAPVELPIGSEHDFRGVIDLLDDKATVYELGSGPPVAGVEGPVPEELASTEHQVHEQLVEGIVVGDDDLMTRYLEGETIGRDELEGTLATGVASAQVFPVLCCSATTGVGIDRLARLIIELCPPCDQRPPVTVQAGEGEVEVECDPSGQPLVVVIKTLSDANSSRLSLAKVLSGTIKPDVVLTNTRARADERLHTLATLRGKELFPVQEVAAGDLFAVPRLTNTSTGDTLAPKGTPVTVSWPTPPEPTLAMAVHPASRTDDDKLMSALQRLGEEDEVLRIRRNDETHQTLLEGAGDVHLAVSLERLQRRFGVNIETEELRIPYRETITHEAQAEGKHKKQSGGHGQFAVCHLRVEPLPRGERFAFIDQVVGGAIPRQFIPAVEKGVIEAMSHGGPHGYPVVDVAVTVDDGKHHPVDSSEMAFKTAAGIGFRTAMAEAGPVLLEPVSMLEVTIPADRQGEVLGDLATRRARIVGTDPDERGNQVVRAQVPEAELRRYAIDLRALTGGRGRFRAIHDHYDVVPDHLVAGIAKELAHA